MMREIAPSTCGCSLMLPHYKSLRSYLLILVISFDMPIKRMRHCIHDDWRLFHKPLKFGITFNDWTNSEVVLPHHNPSRIRKSQPISIRRPWYELYDMTFASARGLLFLIFPYPNTTGPVVHKSMLSLDRTASGLYFTTSSRDTPK